MALFKPKWWGGYYILLFLVSLLSGSETEQHFARTYSIIDDANLELYDLSLSLFTHSQHSQPGLTAQWWPSSNLYLMGTIQPLEDASDLGLYLNAGLAFLPGGTIFGKYHTTLGFGMHRLRFIGSKDYRYYHMRITGTFPARYYNIKVDWLRLFDTNWQENEFHIFLSKELTKRIILQLGTDIPTSVNARFHPLLFVSVGL